MRRQWRLRILDALPEAFEGATLELQQRLLWGELRAAALQILWSSVGDATREQWRAAARETFDDRGDVATTALAFEKSALGKVGEVTAIARAGDHTFRASDRAAYIDYLEFAVGTRLSPSARAEVTAMFVTNFHEDPERTIEIAANLRNWLDKGYYVGKDPQTGRIRSWTAEEQAQMRRDEAASLFCANDKPDDPDGPRLIEILFADNPVVEIDCASRRMTRAGDEVLVEAGDRRLTRAALDAHRQAFELIFAFQFSDEERRWFDAASVADMQKGSKGLTQAIDGFQRIVAEIKEPARIGPQLNEQRREGHAIRVYCANKGTDDPDVARLFDIIDARDPIVFEDCERQSIVRDSDVAGLASSLNFTASLGDFAPLTEQEIAALPDLIRPHFETRTGGPFGYLSTFATLSYWWSHMPVEARHQQASVVKQEIASRADIDAYVPILSQLAGFQLAKLALCNFQQMKLAYDTKRVGLASRTIINTNPNAGSPWVNPEAIGDDLTYYGIMAPLVQAQCGDIWN